MIENINIQGFRGINSLSIENFGKINLLLGKNNCGKTTVLETLFLIIGVTNPVLSRNIHFFRDLILTQTDDFRFLFNKLDFNTKIKIEASVTPNQIRTLIIHPHFFSELPEKDYNMVKESLPDVSSTSQNSTENIEKLILNASIRTQGNSKSQKFQSEISIEGTKQDVKMPQNYKESLKGLFITKDTIYSDLSKNIENILVNKRKSTLLEPLQTIEPQIRDISLGTKGMIYLDLGYARLMPVNLLGEGFRRMLSILTKVSDTRNGIVLLDEIENGLHYSSMKVFIKYLIKIAELQDTQLFITTHSKETLNAIHEIITIPEFSKFKPDIRSFTIRRHKEDKIISYPYDFEKLEYAIEQDIEMR